MNKVKLKKTGQIYIPKSLRKLIDLRVGEYINIFLDGKKIILTNKDGYDKENKCPFSKEGTVYIPSEIRRFGHIKPGAVFTMSFDEKKKQIDLIPH